MQVNAIGITVEVRDASGHVHRHEILLEDLENAHIETLPTRALSVQTKRHLERLIRNVAATPEGMRRHRSGEMQNTGRAG